MDFFLAGFFFMDVFAGFRAEDFFLTADFFFAGDFFFEGFFAADFFAADFFAEDRFAPELRADDRAAGIDSPIIRVSGSAIQPLSPKLGTGFAGIGAGSFVIGVSSIHPALCQPESESSRWDIGAPRRLRGTARRWSRGARGAAVLFDPLT